MKALYLLLFVMFLTFGVQAQKVVKDSTGNYTAVSVGRTKGVDTPTGKTFTDTKGIKYPVFLTSTGRLVYYRVSKNTGLNYKVYIDAK
jgi:hypothetical protein